MRRHLIPLGYYIHQMSNETVRYIGPAPTADLVVIQGLDGEISECDPVALVAEPADGAFTKPMKCYLEVTHGAMLEDIRDHEASTQDESIIYRSGGKMFIKVDIIGPSPQVDNHRLVSAPGLGYFFCSVNLLKATLPEPEEEPDDSPEPAPELDLSAKLDIVIAELTSIAKDVRAINERR